MGGLLACSVTATVTLAGVALPPVTVVVPETGTGLVDVTISLGVAGDLVLVGIPCPTIEDISITLPGGTSVVLSVTEVPAP